MKTTAQVNEMFLKLTELKETSPAVAATAALGLYVRTYMDRMFQQIVY